MHYLVITHIIVSIILIIVITLQEQESATSGIFGGGGGDFYQTRRGLEKIFFGATIISTALFIILAIANLVVPTL